MATVAVALPKPRPRLRHQPVSGRARASDIYFVKAIDNSRLRREVDQKKRRECVALLGLFMVVFSVFLLYSWQHFQCVRYGYEIEQLKARQAGLQEWNQRLRLEQASLEDPQRIDALAREKLGLAAPDPKQVITFQGDTGSPGRVEDSEFARNAGLVGSATAGIARNP